MEGDGFPRQRAAIRAYADANGLKIVRWYEEKGVSGALDLDNRPALSDLMVALHGNGVRTILVERLDRLARDLMIQESIIGEFQKGGFTLVSVSEPDLLQDDPTRKLMRQFMGAIAEWEKKHDCPQAQSSKRPCTGQGGTLRGQEALWVLRG